MKKFLLVLAIAGFATACNNEADKKATTDTVAAKMDTVAAKMDTVAAKMDTVAAKMDTAAKKM